MTMRELAALCKVSVSTVSKAFRNSDEISKETKERILTIAKQQGCFGKYQQQKYKKKIIAIICHEIQSNYYSSMVERFQCLIRQSGCIATVSTDHFDLKQQEELVEYYASYMKADGILVFDLHSPVKKGYDIPIVSLFTSNGCADEIRLDLPSGFSQAVDELYRLGHRNLAFMGEALTQYKAKSFYQAIKQYSDVTYRMFESNKRFEPAGEDCAKELLRDFPRCSAVICAYDNIAFGAMKEFKRQGLRIPDDISLIGCDDLKVGKYMDLELSTIGADEEEFCHLAWDLLQQKIKNKYYRSKQQILLECQLFLRDTVARKKTEK